jgi:hypothetical protein
VSHYGIQVGMVVREHGFCGFISEEFTVTELTHDNNRVVAKDENGRETELIAEWCREVEK